jgi:vancomycin aglycone glucosyltransferase
LHDFIRMIQNPTSALPEVSEHIAQVKADKDTTLTALAEGADLLMAAVANRRSPPTSRILAAYEPEYPR